MSENMKFVDFQKYCHKCVYSSVTPAEKEWDICDECLSCMARENTRKPIRFTESEKYHVQENH